MSIDRMVNSIVSEFKEFATDIPQNKRAITEAFWVFAEDNKELCDPVLESAVRERLINDGWSINEGSISGNVTLEEQLRNILDVT